MSKFVKIVCLGLILAQFLVIAEDYHVTEEEIRQEKNKKIVYYGSTLRFQNYGSQYYLHSHDVQYGSGSRQQSVTAFREDNDYNSLWTIKQGHTAVEYKTYQDEVKCGDIIRFEHMLTNKNLHSHGEKSPLTNNQEVSGYGIDGDGDEGDDWIFECIGQDSGETIKGSSQFNILHKLTKKLLRANKKDNYNKKNCGRQCPIEAQLEISAVTERSPDTEWKIAGGVFFEKQEEQYLNEWEKSSEYSDEDDCEDSLLDDEGFMTVIPKKDDL